MHLPLVKHVSDMQTIIADTNSFVFCTAYLCTRVHSPCAARALWPFGSCLARTHAVDASIRHITWSAIGSLCMPGVRSSSGD